MQIDGGGSTVAIQLMQMTTQVRAQSTQQLQVVNQQMEQTKAASLQTAVDSQTASSGRQQNIIDVMA